MGAGKSQPVGLRQRQPGEPGGTVMLASKTNVTAILPHPPAPTTLEEAGLSLDIVIQLLLKTLHFTGELPGSAAAQGVAGFVGFGAPEQRSWRRTGASGPFHLPAA